MKIESLSIDKIPVYSAVQLSDESSEKLLSLMKKVGIKKDFSDEFHCTTAYSKKPLAIEPVEKDIEVSGVVEDWDLMGNNNETLALIIDCEYCRDRWHEFMDMGASWDYDDYTCHLTLCYDVGDFEMTDDKFGVFEGIELLFDKDIIEEIDETWEQN